MPDRTEQAKGRISATVPLDRLRFGHEAPQGSINPRKTGRDDGLTEMKASIAAEGVLQPLMVCDLGLGDGALYVAIGNRRLAALQALAAESAQDLTDEVPVLILKGVTPAGALEMALAAEIQHVPLHPVDRYEAFAALHAAGLALADIAQRFGIGERVVRQSLALGQLAPPVRAAWRAGDIKADTAQAFTLSPDHAAQERVLKKVARNPWMGAHHVRAELIGEKRMAGPRLAFVGRDAYEAAGGVVTEDLFGDNHAVSDASLLDRLCDARIEDKRARLLADGWSWVVTDREAAGGHYGWQRLPGGKKQTAADKARSGCILRFSGAAIEVEYAVVKPTESRKAKAKAKAKVAAGDDAAPAEAAGISAALRARLGTTLTIAAQTALSAEPETALAALVAALSSWASVVKIRGREPASDLDDFAEAFPRVLALPLKQKLQALAPLVGASLKLFAIAAHHREGRDDDGSATVVLVDALRPAAMNAALRGAFDAADYFGSAPKPVVLAAIEEAVGTDYARALRAKPKGEIVDFAVVNVAAAGWLPAELRTAHYDGPAVGKATAEIAKASPVKKPAGSKAGTATKTRTKGKGKAGGKPRAKPRR